MLVWIQNPFDNLPCEGFRRMRYALMADAFARAGHEVVFWTSDFSHARKARRAAEPEAGAWALRLVKTLPYGRNVSLRRAWSHWLYAREWERQATSAAASAAPALVVTSFPTISGAQAALRLARRFGAKAVVDVQDAWPETFERLAPRRLRGVAHGLLAPLRARARQVFGRADLVTGVCARYRDLVGRADYRLAYLGIEPGPRPSPPRRPGTGGPRVAYVGGLGRTYDLETVRAGVARLGGELVVAGGRQYLGAADLERMLASCDVGVVPMASDSWVGIPNKMFDYAKAGLPVVSSLGGESADLLARYRCGVAYRAGDAGSFADAVRRALALERGASRRMCEEAFDATRIYDDYVRFVSEGAA